LVESFLDDAGDLMVMFNAESDRLTKVFFFKAHRLWLPREEFDAFLVLLSICVDYIFPAMFLKLFKLLREVGYRQLTTSNNNLSESKTQINLSNNARISGLRESIYEEI
jgi:hypothetical protein